MCKIRSAQKNGRIFTGGGNFSTGGLAPKCPPPWLRAWGKSVLVVESECALAREFAVSFLRGSVTELFNFASVTGVIYFLADKAAVDRAERESVYHEFQPSVILRQQHGGAVS